MTDKELIKLVHQQVEAMKLALEAYLCREMPAGTIIGDPKWWVPKIAMALREALEEQPAQQEFVSPGGGYVPAIPAQQPAQQEPVALKWQQAPIRTAWGDEMVVASVAIDKDHTLSLYCERDQAPKVEAMFAQRTWFGLTDEEKVQLWNHDTDAPLSYADAIEATLRSKNT